MTVTKHRLAPVAGRQRISQTTRRFGVNTPNVTAVVHTD